METGEIDITKVRFGKEKLKIQSKTPSHAVEPLKLQKSSHSGKFYSPKGEIERRDPTKQDNLSLSSKPKSQPFLKQRSIMKWDNMNKNNQNQQISSLKLKNLVSAKLLKKSTGNFSDNSNSKNKKEVTFRPGHQRTSSNRPLKEDSEECSPNDISLSFSEEDDSDHLQVPNSRPLSQFANSEGMQESKIASAIGEKITKSTTKNLKQIVEENESSSEECDEEEDEKMQENQQKKRVIIQEPSKNFDTPRQGSVNDILKEESKQESSSQSDFFTEDKDEPSSNRIWEYMKHSS